MEDGFELLPMLFSVKRKADRNRTVGIRERSKVEKENGAKQCRNVVKSSVRRVGIERNSRSLRERLGTEREKNMTLRR
jgi:hypothetical protein